MYVIELDQLERQHTSEPRVSPNAEEDRPAGDDPGEKRARITIPAQAGPPSRLPAVPMGPPAAAGSPAIPAARRAGVVWTRRRTAGGPAFSPSVTPVEAGFFSWDMATGEVTFEDGLHALHGLPGEGPATIAELLDRVPDEDAASLISAMREMMAACGTYQVEYQVLDTEGTLRSMEARGRVLPGPDGRPAG